MNQSLPNTQFTDSLYYTSVVLHSVLPSFCLSLHLMFLASEITTASSCYQQYPAVLTTLLPLAMISTNSTTLYCCDKQQNRSFLFLLFAERIFVCWNFKKNLAANRGIIEFSSLKWCCEGENFSYLSEKYSKISLCGTRSRAMDF